MKWLVLSYLATIVVNCLVGVVCGLVIGFVSVCAIVGAVCGTFTSGLHFFQLWRGYQRRKAQAQAQEQLFRSLGIDVDKLRADAIKADQERAEKRAAGAN